MLLPRANEAARAGSIAAAATRRRSGGGLVVIGRRNRQLLPYTTTTTTTAAPAAASRASPSLLSSSHHSTASRPSSKTTTVGNTMNHQPTSPASGTSPQRHLSHSPNNAGLWNPSRGIHFATGTGAGTTVTGSTTTAAPVPAPLAAHKTPEFKRRRRVDVSAQPPLPAPPRFSGARNLQTSSRNASSMADEDEEGELQMEPKEPTVPESDEGSDFYTPPPARASYVMSSEPPEPPNVLHLMSDVDNLEKRGRSVQNYFKSATEKLDNTVEPQEYNEKVWQAAQEGKHLWDRKTRTHAPSERGAAIEELLMPDGMVDFWDIVSPFDKAVKMYKDNGTYSSTYKDMAMAKHKRDARVTDIDKMQLPMLERQPDPRLLEEYFSLRATAFDIFVAYALAGPLEIRKLYELVMVERRLLKMTSTMQREVINKRYLRDEQILGLGIKVNIASVFRVPKNYSLTDADTEVVNNAFEKSPLRSYHAFGAANPWEHDEVDQAPAIFVPPVRYPGAEDVGLEDVGFSRHPGDPRTRYHRRQIQRAMFWAQRYTELSWRTQRMRMGKEPGGGVSWSQKEFTIDDVDTVMGRYNLKPSSKYTYEDALRRSVENTKTTGNMRWDEDRVTWDSVPTATLSFDDFVKVPNTSALYPDTRSKDRTDAARKAAADRSASDLAAELQREIYLLNGEEAGGFDETNVEMGDEDLWSADESDECVGDKVLASGDISEVPGGHKVGKEGEEFDVEELLEKDAEEALEVEAAEVPKKKKRSASALVKLADEDEPPYQEPDYILDSALVAKSTRTDPKKGTLAQPFFSFRHYRKSSRSNKGFSSPAMRYCETVVQMDMAMKMFQDCTVLGFDMEWAAFGSSKNPKNNVSLIQVASHDAIVLFHLAMMSKYDFPQRLKEVLEDEKVIKTGVAIKGDATRLLKHWNVQANGLIDLCAYHKIVADEADLKRASLASLTECYTTLGLSKDPKIRRSHWERALSADQRLYAANDAYACIKVFDEMERKRHEMEPRPARPDCFQTELQGETEAKPKKRITRKAVQEIEEEVLKAISKESDPLAALKEHQGKAEAGVETDKVLQEESSENDSDDSFQRLPTPEDSSASEVEPTPITGVSGKMVKKTSARMVKATTQRAIITDISGKREFSTGTTTSTSLSSSSSSSSNLQAERSFFSKKPNSMRRRPDSTEKEIEKAMERRVERDLVPGDPELMRSVDVNHGRGAFSTLIHSPRVDREIGAPPKRSSERKFEADLKPFRIISKKEANPPPPKYQLKAISREPGHEEPNNGPRLSPPRQSPIRRIYPPELMIAQQWARVVVNAEMVPRKQRSQANPGGSGNQLAIYHLWHIQGFSIGRVQEILSAYNDVSEDQVHQRLCQAIAMFPVSYDRVRIKNEVFINASYDTQQTKFYHGAMQRFKDDAAGKKQERNPEWINENVTKVDKEYQKMTTVNRDYPDSP